MLIKKFEKYNPKLFAKGKRGLIYVFVKNNKKYALKIKNPDSFAMGRIENEAKFLKILNKYSIGPKLVESGDGYVCYNFINAEYLKDYLKNKDNHKIIFDKIMKQCEILDSLGINKEEMHHPNKNILVFKNKPILIDFERCRFTTRPKNVNQFKEFIRRTKVNV